MPRMVITWHGQGMIKLVGKVDQPVTLVFDPYNEKDTGLRPPRPEANAVLLSASAGSGSGSTSSSSKEANTDAFGKDAFVISGPGEFDIKGVTIRGIPSYHDDQQGGKYGANTIYIVRLEGITICHLGCLGHQLSERQLSDIGDCDVLIVPVGGDRTLDGKLAASVVNKVEPRIVIPTHFALPKLKYKIDGPEKFLKELGADKSEPQPRLKLKKSGLPKDTIEVALLQKA